MLMTCDGGGCADDMMVVVVLMTCDGGGCDDDI